MNGINLSGKMNYFTIVFLLSLCSVGVFHEFTSCFFSLAILAGLFVYEKKNGEFRIDINLVSISAFVICVSYLVTAFWAIDAGMSVIGFFKYLPVLLFLLALFQETRIMDQIYLVLPYISAIMVVVSYLFMQIPNFEEYFSVAGRLAGFLQYPNTFAILLLVSELLVISKENIKKSDYVISIILLAGIILSGSRTVFVLMLVANIVMALIISKKRNRYRVFAIVIIAVISLCAVVSVLGGTYLTERFLQISAAESTFTGRLLYYKDALPVIMQNPFGLGYMGHYYLQPMIQTGVYSVRYIHNDFLQLALDIGWIPCILFVLSIIKSLFSKRVVVYKKLIIIVISAHACFDFDLQFIAIFCLLIMFLDINVGRNVICVKGRLGKIILVILVISNLYMGIALTASAMNKTEVSNKLYPWNTQNQVKYILQTSDVNTQEKLADSILTRNEYVTLTYSVKARNAYLDGDYTNLILWKNKMFDIAPFQYDEYEDYCYKLIDGIEIYSQIADQSSIDICIEELLSTQHAVHNIESKLSDLGRRIKDQPETELPEEIEKYIEELGESNE